MSQVSSIDAVAPGARPGRASAATTGAAIFAVACLAAIASDVATPLATAVIPVGAVLFVLVLVLGVAAFRSGQKLHEAAMLALIAPLALCGYAAFDLREGPAGRPPTGVIARTLPAVERLQARRLPLGADLKAVLLLEVTLKTGDAASKAAAIAGIADAPAAPFRKYLYETAARFGDQRQKQDVAAALLAGRHGEPVSIDLLDDDHTTLFAQYLEGASIVVAPLSPGAAIHAQLRTNKERVALQGRLTGPTLTLAGKASVADKGLPLTLDASMGRDLTFTGTVRLDGGQDVAVAFRPLQAR